MACSLCPHHVLQPNQGIPNDYLIVPSLGPGPVIEGSYTTLRIVALCREPYSTPDGVEHKYHVPVSSTTFEIRNPSEFLSKNQNLLSGVDSLLRLIFSSASMYANIAGYPFPNLADALGEWNKLWIGNREHIKVIGLTEEKPFASFTLHTDLQRAGMLEIINLARAENPLSAISYSCNLHGFKEGNSVVWKCGDCAYRTGNHKPMSDGHQVTLKQFAQLSQRKNKFNDITLANADGVQIFTYTLSHSIHTTKIHLYINMLVFSDPANTAAPGTIQSNSNAFRLLRESMLKQLNLQDVKIVAFTPNRPHASTPNQPDASEVLTVMDGIFSCKTLLKLELRDLKFVLQSKIDIRCHCLTHLRLDGVRVNTERAAENLFKLITQNKLLVVLHLNRMSFTRDSIANLLSSKNMDKLKARLLNLTELAMAGNRELSCDQLLGFVSMAVGNSNAIKLKRLNLSQNDRMGDQGWSMFLTKFEMLRSKLTVLEHHGTGASERMSAQLNYFPDGQP